ncbi:helix-turn-helix domain-containing protein [bacterium]|nr:helix-turn-helix domain-containing protein [bacterium]
MSHHAYKDGKDSKALLSFPVDRESSNNRDSMFFDNSEWLTTEETAIYLRKFFSDGSPNTNPIHKMVSRGLIRRRKFGGRLYFRKRELDFLIESGATYTTTKVK